MIVIGMHGTTPTFELLLVSMRADGPLSQGESKVINHVLQQR